MGGALGDETLLALARSRGWGGRGELGKISKVQSVRSIRDPVGGSKEKAGHAGFPH